MEEPHDVDLLAAADPGLPVHLLEHLPAASSVAAANSAASESLRLMALRNNKALLESALRASTPRQSRVMMMRHVASEWSNSMQDTSACRSGCSHCCHIAVSIPETEARLIARKVGVRLAEPARPHFVFQAAPPFDHGYHKPCPFLRDNKCSIYEHRPYICRRLVNLDSVDLLCQLIPGQQVPVPYADGRALDAIFLKATSSDRIADIRDWFPSVA